MKCADHPEKEAVAIIKSEEYNSYFGACSDCYKKHKKNQDLIEQHARRRGF